jgi:hypothetical protein
MFTAKTQRGREAATEVLLAFFVSSWLEPSNK